MKKQLIYTGFIWFSIAMLTSCYLFKKADYSDQTPVEMVPDEEMLTGEDQSEEIEEIETESPQEHASLVTYERTYCFGMCPVFKSEVLKDGTVIYEGINFVDNMGKFTAMASETEVDSIKSMLVSINYFELDSVYDNPSVTDIPAVLSSANLDGNSNSIYARWKAPKELRNLYNLLDRIYSRLEWTAVLENE